MLEVQCGLCVSVAWGVEKSAAFRSLLHFSPSLSLSLSRHHNNLTLHDCLCSVCVCILKATGGLE